MTATTANEFYRNTEEKEACCWVDDINLVIGHQNHGTIDTLSNALVKDTDNSRIC
jgi:hypothetical protein